MGKQARQDGGNGGRFECKQNYALAGLSGFENVKCLFVHRILRLIVLCY